jgi:hypothetical protein
MPKTEIADTDFRPQRIAYLRGDSEPARLIRAFKTFARLRAEIQSRRQSEKDIFCRQRSMHKLRRRHP